MLHTYCILYIHNLYIQYFRILSHYINILYYDILLLNVHRMIEDRVKFHEYHSYR